MFSKRVEILLTDLAGQRQGDIGEESKKSRESNTACWEVQESQDMM